MGYKVLQEKRLANGLVIRTERKAGPLRRVSVCMPEPLELHDNICSETEAACLVDRLAAQYGAFTISDLFLA